MIGAAMQAPLTGLVLIVELTHSGLDLAVPMIAATVLATAITHTSTAIPSIRPACRPWSRAELPPE